MSDCLADGIVVLGKYPITNHMEKGGGMSIHKPLEKDKQVQETQLCFKNHTVVIVWCFQAIKSKSENTQRNKTTKTTFSVLWGLLYNQQRHPNEGYTVGQRSAWSIE